MFPESWQLPLGATIGALFVIITLRANGTYWLGRAIVAGTAKTRWAKMLDSKAYRTGSRFLNRWGAPAVTLSFLTIGLQTTVLIGAGVTRMPLRRFIPACQIGCVVWACMYGTVGFIGFVAIGRLWEFSPVLTVVLAVALAAGIVLTVRRQPEDAVSDAPGPVGQESPAA